MNRSLERDTAPSHRQLVRRRARRAFYLFLFLGAVVVIWGVFSAAGQLADIDRGSTTSEVLGLTLFEAEKDAGGSTLRPEIGLPIVLVLIPLLAAGIVSLVGRLERPRDQHFGRAPRGQL